MYTWDKRKKKSGMIFTNALLFDKDIFEGWLY